MKWCARKEDSHGLRKERHNKTGQTAFGRRMLLAMGGWLLITGIASTARSADDQRYKYVEDLLRSLVESEMERMDSRQNDASYTPQKRKSPSSQLAQARPLLMRYSNEATGLTRDLDRQLDRRPKIRPIFGDVLRLRAKAYVLAQTSYSTNDHELVASDFSAMSADWQTLSYQLRQMRGLENDVIAHMDAIDKHDKELANILQVSSRIDRQDVLAQLSSLKTDLDKLQDTLETELERSPQRRQLVATGKQLELQCDQVASMVNSNAPYDPIVAEYRKFQDGWNAYAVELRALNNRAIERSLRRVDHADHELHAMFRLPYRIDRKELFALTNALKQEVDEFYLRAPLKLLITLDNGSAVIPTCNEFYGVCEHFADSVERGADHEQLLEDYHYVDESWIAFQTMFRELNSSKAQAVLADIERGIVSLREALQLSGGFDRDESLNLAVALLKQSEDFHSRLHDWLDRNPKSFGKAALQETHELIDATKQLQEHITAGSDTRQLQRDSRDISARWRHIHDYLKLVNTGDANPLRRTSARITPIVVELETKLEI